MAAWLSDRTFPTLPSNPTAALVDFVTACNLPTSVVDNPSLINFVEVIRGSPKSRLPCAQTVASTHYPKRYAEVLTDIAACLGRADKIGFTTDGWTGPQALGYWSLTGNLIDTDFKWVSTPISLIPIPGKHDTANIAKAIVDKLRPLKVPVSKIAGITTDEGGAAPCVAKHIDFAIVEQHCACHLCQTALKSAFKQTFLRFPNFENLLQTCGSFASAFRYQSSFRGQIIACQHAYLKERAKSTFSSMDVDQRSATEANPISLPPANQGPTLDETSSLRIKSPATTRWCSQIDTAESLLPNQRPIRDWLNKLPPTNVLYDKYRALDSRANWDILEDFVKVGKLARAFTKRMEAENTPTLHLLVYQFYLLISMLNNHESLGIKTQEGIYYKDCLIVALKTKFEGWNDAEKLAFFLNPTCRHLQHSSDETDPRMRIWSDGKRLASKWLSAHVAKPATAPPEPPKAPLTTDPFELAAEQDRKNSEANKSKDVIRTEIEVYLDLKVAEEIAKDVLLFWKDSKLALLSQLAREILCIPASQASSERVFSLMRHILTDFRGSLAPQTAKKLMLISWVSSRRNRQLRLDRKRPRSAKSVIADPSRAVARAHTLQEQQAARIADHSLPPRPANTTAAAAPVPGISMEEVVAENEFVELFGDGEDEDDSDYDFVERDNEDFAPPEPKRAAPGAPPSRTRRLHPTLRLRSDASDAVICGVWENVDEAIVDQSLIERALGSQLKYYENITRMTPSCSLEWRWELNEQGQAKFHGSATRAICRFKGVIVL